MAIFALIAIWITCGFINWPSYFYIFYGMKNKKISPYEVKSYADDLKVPAFLFGPLVTPFILPLLFLKILFYMFTSYNNSNSEQGLTLFEKLAGESNLK